MADNAKDFEMRGRELWYRGEYDAALKILRQGLAAFPADAALRLGIAMTQLKLGNFAIARDELMELAAIMPHNGDVLAALCEASINLGRRQDALRYAYIAANNFPSSAALLEHLGMVFLEHGMFEDAVMFFGKTLVLDSRRQYSRLGIAVASRGLGRVDEAIHQARMAVRIRKNFYEGLSYLGNLLHEKGDIKAAHEVFMKIPPAEHIDPQAITRHIEYLAQYQRYETRIAQMKQRLSELSGIYDIGSFLHKLEQQARRTRSSGQKNSFAFVRIKRFDSLDEEGKTALRSMDGLLRRLFGKPARPVRFDRFPKTLSFDAVLADEFFSHLALYVRKLAVFAGREGGPGARWSAAWGIDSLAPYAVSLLAENYSLRGGGGLSQQSMDNLLAGIVNIAKWSSKDSSSSEWLTELGGILTAFWTGADMMDRIFLLRELLDRKQRHAIEPVISRGRAWRRWLGFKAEKSWSYPAAEMFQHLAKSSPGKPVKCAKCGAEIKDYWEIADPSDNQSAKCGDCATLIRCGKCGGPMRQVAFKEENGAKIFIYVCAECRTRFQASLKRGSRDL